MCITGYIRSIIIEINLRKCADMFDAEQRGELIEAAGSQEASAKRGNFHVMSE